MDGLQVHVNVSCEKCNNKVLGKYIIVADKGYHLECFTCDLCQGAVTEGFYKHSSQILCEKCFAKEMSENAATCSVCREKVVLGVRVKWSGGEYHKRCLVCCKCGTNFSRDSDVCSSNEKLYCVKCQEQSDDTATSDSNEPSSKSNVSSSRKSSTRFKTSRSPLK